MTDVLENELTPDFACDNGILVPIYSVEGAEDSVNVRHAVCQYYRDNAWHIDLFLFRYNRDIQQQLWQAKVDAGFPRLEFLFWLGERDEKIEVTTNWR